MPWSLAGTWIRGPLKAWLILHRPVKVERTRKRSEGFPPDRKVEKKKGEEGLHSAGCSLRSSGGMRGGPGRASGSCQRRLYSDPALPALLPAEPSVEEKLQKLHSEIKFALKVDNPVRPSLGYRGHG